MHSTQLVVGEKMFFKECPKLVVLWLVSRNNLGKEFHNLGPSTENARRPHEFRRHDELMTSGEA